MRDVIPPSFSLIPADSDFGVAVFAWLTDSAGNEMLGDSLLALPEAAVADAIVRFAFTYMENTYMSPAWWASLPSGTVDSLTARMRSKPTPASLVSTMVCARWRGQWLGARPGRRNLPEMTRSLLISGF